MKDINMSRILIIRKETAINTSLGESEIKYTNSHSYINN